MSAVCLSIILITRNQAWNLARALDAIQKQLPDLPPTEVLVVDSASTDDTVAIAQSYPGVRVLRLTGQQRLSPAAGRYAGFQYARGQWILHADGDTELLAGWIPRSMQALQQNSSLAGISGKLFHILNGANTHLPPENPAKYQLRTIHFLRGGAGIYRRSALEQAGSFDPWICSEEEAELALRLRNAGFELAEDNWYCAVHRDEVAPLTLSSPLIRYRKGLLYGQGQVLRKHFGTRIFCVFLKERSHLLAAPLCINLLALLAAASALLAHSWLPVTVFSGFCLVGLFALRRSKGSFYQAIRVVLAFELLFAGTLRGFFLPLPPATTYNVENIELQP